MNKIQQVKICIEKRENLEEAHKILDEFEKQRKLLIKFYKNVVKNLQDTKDIALAKEQVQYYLKYKEDEHLHNAFKILDGLDQKIEQMGLSGKPLVTLPGISNHLLWAFNIQWTIIVIQVFLNLPPCTWDEEGSVNNG